MKKILCGFNLWPEKREEPLYTPIYTVVDDEDYEWLNKFNWSLTGSGPFYAARNIYSPELYKKKAAGVNTSIKMHHAIMGKPPVGKVIHHINGNSLDNRRSNLLVTTQRYNVMSNSKWNPIVKMRSRYQLRISFPTLEEAKEALRRHLEDYPD